MILAVRSFDNGTRDSPRPTRVFLCAGEDSPRLRTRLTGNCSQTPASSVSKRVTGGFRKSQQSAGERSQRYHVRVGLPDGRNQIVSIECVEDAETHEEIVRVFSVCGPTSASYYERALHLNAAMSHGAIGIEMVSGIPHFVMVNSYPRATCDPHEIRTSMMEVAKYADQVERLLTGEDHF